MKSFEHRVIRTPSDVVNVVGCGGINERTITELYGKPRAGKSAFAYGAATFFLEDYPDGIVKIIDAEISTDEMRLENTFQMDMDRVIITQKPILEDCYDEMFDVFRKLDAQQKAEITVARFIEDFEEKTAIKLLKKAELDYNLDKIYNAPTEEKAVYELQKLANLLSYYGQLKPDCPTPVFIIWDTIAAAKTRKEVEAAMTGADPVNAGGLGHTSRINSVELSIVMTHLAKYPVTMFVLNQIRKTFQVVGKGMQIARDTSSGGNVLKHNAHYVLYFRDPKHQYDEDLRMNIGTMSFVDVEKSKFGPTVKGIPLWIDDRMGGIIVQREEAALMCSELELLTHYHKAWYRFVGEETSYLWERGKDQEEGGNYVAGNPAIRLKCLDHLARHFRRNYYLLDILYQKLGMSQGQLTEEDRKVRADIVKNFSVKDVLRNIDQSEPSTSDQQAFEDVPVTFEEESSEPSPIANGDNAIYQPGDLDAS